LKVEAAVLVGVEKSALPSVGTSELDGADADNGDIEARRAVNENSYGAVGIEIEGFGLDINNHFLHWCRDKFQ
jgi:hypothetical protein